MKVYQNHRSPNLKFICSAQHGTSIKAYEDIIKHLVRESDFGRRPIFESINPILRRLGLFRINKRMVCEYLDYRDPPFGSRCIRVFPHPIKTSTITKYAKKFSWLQLEPTDTCYLIKESSQLSNPLPRLGSADEHFDVLRCDEKQWELQLDRIMMSLMRSDVTPFTYIYDIIPHILLQAEGNIAVEPL